MNETSEIAPAVVAAPSVHGTSDDDMHWGKILVVAGTTLLVFAITIVCSTSLLHHEEESLGRAPQALAAAPFPKARPYEVGIINQAPFIEDQRADVKRDQQLRYLHGFGWADRSQKLIHIPIEEGMKMVLAEQAKRTAQGIRIELAPQSETEAPPPASLAPVTAPQPTTGAAQPVGGVVKPANAVQRAVHAKATHPGAKAPAAHPAGTPSSTVPASGGAKR